MPGELIVLGTEGGALVPCLLVSSDSVSLAYKASTVERQMSRIIRSNTHQHNMLLEQALMMILLFISTHLVFATLARICCGKT